MIRSGSFPPRLAALATSLVMVVALGACGNRLPQSEIEAAAQGNSATAGSVQQSGSNTSGAGGVNTPSTAAPVGGATEANPTAGTGAQSSGTPGAASGNSGASAGAGSGGIASSGNGSSSAGAGSNNSTGGGDSSGSSGSSGSGSSSSGGSSSSSSGSTATGSTIAIGNVGDYSGVLGALLGPAQPALGVWVKYINAHGGLAGHPVQLISADTGGDPSTNQTDVQQLVQEDHVLAMVGDTDILDFTGSEQYLVEHGIPDIGGVLPGNEFQVNPTFFPEGAPFTLLAAIAIPTAIHEGYDKVGAVYCIETALCQTTLTQLPGPAGVVAQAHGQFVYEAAASLTSPSFTSQCLGAQSAKVQVLELILDAASITRFAQDCAAQGYDPLYETVTVGAIPSLDTIPQLNGLILPNYTFPFTANSSPATEAFQTAMQDYSPTTPIGPAASIEWASGQLLKAGSADLGPTPTYPQLIAGLDTLKNDTIGGLTVPLTFAAGKDAVVPNCVFLSKIQSGTWIAPNGLNPVCT